MTTKPTVELVPRHTKHVTYSDLTRAKAVALALELGYPETKGALTRAAEQMGVHEPTLYRWITGRNNPPAYQDVQEQRADLQGMLAEIAQKYAAHTLEPDVINATSASSSMVVAGIAIDKLRLLQGLPTAIIGVMPDFIGALEAAGQDPLEFMRRVMTRLQIEAESEQPVTVVQQAISPHSEAD